MSWLALGLLCAFLAVVFPLRAIRQRARSGSRSPWRRQRPASWVLADALVSAGFLLSVAGPALGDPATSSPAAQTAGVALALAAIALAVWAQETMGRAWRTDIEPDGDAGLVTNGPFAVVRNPNYVAMLAAVTSALLIAPSVLGPAGAVALLAGLMLTARCEERRLEETFGDAYRSYAARVGRFVPGVGRLGKQR